MYFSSIRLTVFFITGMLLFSCNKNNDLQPLRIGIDSVSPRFTEAGKEIKIYGNFSGYNPQTHYLTIGNTTVAGQLHSNYITATVPDSTFRNYDSLTTRITIGYRQGKIIDSIYLYSRYTPRFEAVDTAAVFPLDTITITGKGFVKERDASRIYFLPPISEWSKITSADSIKANIVNITETSIILTVPLNARTGQLVLSSTIPGYVPQTFTNIYPVTIYR